MKKSIVAFLLAFTVSIISYSQVTFSGKVVDENSVPLPGASVVVKGGSTGVATDFDGNFGDFLYRVHTTRFGHVRKKYHNNHVTAGFTTIGRGCGNCPEHY